MTVLAGGGSSGGAVALGNHTLTTGAAGINTRFDGVISGSGGLSKQGRGTLVFSGDNSAYSGAISVQAGVLRVQSGGAQGSTAGNTSVASGAGLELAGGFNLAEPMSLAGSGVAVAGGTPAGGALRNISGSNTVTGAINLAADARINSDAGSLLLDVPAGSALVGVGRTLSVGGTAATSVADALTLCGGTLVNDGAGTLTLSGGGGSLGATLVNAGTLAAGGANVLPAPAR